MADDWRIVVTGLDREVADRLRSSDRSHRFTGDGDSATAYVETEEVANTVAGELRRELGSARDVTVEWWDGRTERWRAADDTAEPEHALETESGGVFDAVLDAVLDPRWHQKS